MLWWIGVFKLSSRELSNVVFRDSIVSQLTQFDNSQKLHLNSASTSGELLRAHFDNRVEAQTENVFLTFFDCPESGNSTSAVEIDK